MSRWPAARRSAIRAPHRRQAALLRRRRRPLPRHDVPAVQGPRTRLIGWSGDKTRTLFAEIGPTKSATEVDLRAGHQTDIPLGAWSASARHTMPDGKALRRAVAASSTQWRSGASVDLDHHDNGG